MGLYEKVKALAEAKGFSIASLEKAAGLANGTIGKWRKSGKGATLNSIKAIAKTLNISIEELL